MCHLEFASDFETIVYGGGTVLTEVEVIPRILATEAIRKAPTILRRGFRSVEGLTTWVMKLTSNVDHINH